MTFFSDSTRCHDANLSRPSVLWLLANLLVLTTACGVPLPDEEIAMDEAALGGVRTDSEGSAYPTAVATYFAGRFRWRLDSVRFGEYHSHSSYSADAATCGAAPGIDTLDPTESYQYASEETDLDFVGLSDHAEFPNPLARPREHRRQGLSVWQSELQLGLEANDEDTGDGDALFVFADWEYTNTAGSDGCGSEHGFGHKNVIFRDLNPDVLPAERFGACLMSDDTLAADAWALYDALDAYRPACDDCVGRALTIVHTPAMVGDLENTENAQNHSTDWDSLDPDFTRHVELVSKWGSSEGHAPVDAGCADSDRPLDYADGDVDENLAVRTTLYERWVVQGDPRFQLGFVGGTDNHVGQPGNDQAGQCGMNFRGSLTGIVAPTLTRGGLWQNLWDRHTITVSTGSRIPLLVAVETASQHIAMGELGNHDGTLRVRALAGAQVSELHLIVDGCLDRVIEGNALDVTLEVDPDSRHFLYVRAIERRSDDDVVQAWSSPIYLGEAAAD